MIEKFSDLWNVYSGDFFSFLRRLLAALLIIIAGRVLAWVLRKLIRRAEVGGLWIDKTLISMLKALVRYGVIIICVIMILDAFGVNTNSLIAVLGTAGVAVGLALKDTLSNIAAGIVLIVQRTYQRGDWIEFGSIQGSVREIGLFTTILETGDGIYISAPNSSIWGTPLKNYTRNGKRRMDLSVSIAYTDSIDTAFQVLREIIAAEDRFLKDPAPQIMVQSLDDSGVTILLRAWAVTGEYWNVYWAQMRNIKERLEAAGLTIPFPQRDIHIIPANGPTRSPAAGR
ncbi:MAG: mechanosensitive ion channel [Spirochaetaceae bacterium]|jgi:small conductance mechanosensitive channel|nr:mechanosensitive ion channel [Spirochaetaceae bacterium]